MNKQKKKQQQKKKKTDAAAEACWSGGWRREAQGSGDIIYMDAAFKDCL